MAKTQLPKTKKELKVLKKATNELLKINNKEYDRLSKLLNEIEEASYNAE